LGSSYSLLQKTLLRFLGSYEASSIVVIAGLDFVREIRDQCNELDPREEIAVIAEKQGRSTAPALALAFCFLQEKEDFDVCEPILVVPCDGMISPLDNFLEEVSLAKRPAEEGFIVLFGVTPRGVETSYGHIDLGPRKGHFFTGSRFIEKPSFEIATALMNEKNVLWNTGHLVLSAKTFWEEIESHFPEIGALKGLSFFEANEILHTMPAISLDYALLEKSKLVLISKIPVSWSDLGTWERIYNAFEKDPEGNVKIGNVNDIGSKNCFFLTDRHIVVTIGLEDLVVVSTSSGILIAKKEDAHKIGSIKEKISKGIPRILTKLESTTLL